MSVYYLRHTLAVIVERWSDHLCTRSRQLETHLCSSDLNRRPVESVFLMARMLLCGLPTGSRKSICLPFMFDKKLGRDNSVVVVVHHYLQQLSPTCAAHVCTLDKHVEADCHLTALER